MFDETIFFMMTDHILFALCIFILIGSVFISFKTNFIQIRFIPALFQMMKTAMSQEKQKTDAHTIAPNRALFTAMSTTLGIGSIVGPIFAISLGGPGALIGFLLTAFFGSAATYTEVNLCIKYRKRLESGKIQGGPMQYLEQLLSPKAAVWYAVCGSLLMAGWSGAQANQLAAILDSPLLGDYRIPTFVSATVLAALVLFVLIGGTKRVSSISAKIVPVMFVLYLGSLFWILGTNITLLPGVFEKIFEGLFSPYALASGALVGGIVSSMRWGIFKGTQVTEAGVGTQTIPHSMAETNDPHSQGMLAMLSTYSAGMIAFLSGCVALITNTWQNPELPLGISMVAASFEMYFSYFGIAIVAISTLLFAFGTILGNSYNGSQCFDYLTKGRGVYAYYIGSVILIFLGTIADAKNVWSYIDFGLAFIVLPHMTALIIYAYKYMGSKISTKPVRDIL